MSFDWFGTENEGALRLFSVGRTAWEGLEYIRIVLAITAMVALVVVALRLAGAAQERLVRANAVVALLGMLSALLILFRIVDPPDFGSIQEVWGTFPIEGTVKFPIFLGLFAALGIALGGWWAHRDDAG